MSIVTEAEAKKMWCPFSRVAFLGGAVANRVSSARLRAAQTEAERTGDDRDFKFYAEQVVDTQCLGSLCMAWRAAPDRLLSSSGNPPYVHEPRPGMGYCGLAGKV